MSGISYIIPTIDEAALIGPTLDRVNRQPGSKEVIVSDGGSLDSTLSIAAAKGCQIVPSPRGRGSQLNRGASVASKRILMFLHADTLIPDNAAREINSLLMPGGPIAGSFRLRFQPSSPALRFYAFCSRINHPLFTYGDQGLFILKSAFHAIGGFKEYPILEDIEIQSRIRACGRFEKSVLSVTTSARRFQRRGPIRQQLLNATILAAYFGGAKARTLSGLYANIR